MLILAIDTSGRNGSLALAEGDAHKFQVLEVAPLEMGMYSAQLIPRLSELLNRLKLDKSAIGAFAVVSGPGSFTGLRVGLSTVKGLAEVTGQPIAAVSALEAVAFANDRGRVIAALDAGRGQIFLGEYQVGGGGAVRIREWMVTLQELIAARACTEEAEIPLVTPDESVAQDLQAHNLVTRTISRPHADVVARIGLGRILRRETVSPEALDANYIRRSDAELFSLPKPTS
jgi:tRNA threonylcarbamoyladenosine biosynthesis protein TsaB